MCTSNAAGKKILCAWIAKESFHLLHTVTTLCSLSHGAVFNPSHGAGSYPSPSALHTLPANASV